MLLYVSKVELLMMIMRIFFAGGGVRRWAGVEGGEGENETFGCRGAHNAVANNCSEYVHCRISCSK